jgi:hypothetical protein
MWYRACHPHWPARWSNVMIVFELSLCLSRACLGKVFVFSIYKWLKKTVVENSIEMCARPFRMHVPGITGVVAAHAAGRAHQLGPPRTSSFPALCCSTAPTAAWRRRTMRALPRTWTSWRGRRAMAMACHSSVRGNALFCFLLQKIPARTDLIFSEQDRLGICARKVLTKEPTWACFRRHAW